jgi:hypothetical protein
VERERPERESQRESERGRRRERERGREGGGREDGGSGEGNLFVGHVLVVAAVEQRRGVFAKSNALKNSSTYCLHQ